MISRGMSMSSVADAGKQNSSEIARVLGSFYLRTYDEDIHVSRMCKTNGFWEPDVTAWMTGNVEPGWTCLDIGSNIGYFTEVLARLVGSDGSVHAFEPNPQVFDDYRRVMNINNYDSCGDIHLHNFGLSNSESTEVLVVPPFNVGGASVKFGEDTPEDWRKVDVELKVYDDLPFSGMKVDFIKMDVEGCEPDAFAGMVKALVNCKLLVMELGPYHPVEFLNTIGEMYTIHQISGDREIEIGINDIIKAPHHLNVALRRRSA